MKGVEAVLQSLNVQRQKYHGGAFIGIMYTRYYIFSERLNTCTHALTSDAYDSTCTEYSSVNQRDCAPPC